jgi:hypothetical protein
MEDAGLVVRLGVKETEYEYERLWTDRSHTHPSMVSPKRICCQAPTFHVWVPSPFNAR